MSGEPLPKSEIILYQTDDGRTRVQFRMALVPLLAVREAFREAVAARDGAGHAEFLEHRPVLRVAQFHGLEAHRGRVLREFLDGHRVEAPRHDGLADASVGDAVRSFLGGCGGECGGACRCEEFESGAAFHGHSMPHSHPRRKPELPQEEVGAGKSLCDLLPA